MHKGQSTISIRKREIDWRGRTRCTGKEKKSKEKEKEREKAGQGTPMFSRWKGEETAGRVASAARGAGTANLALEGKEAGTKKAGRGGKTAKAATSASGTNRGHTSKT